MRKNKPHKGLQKRMKVTGRNRVKRRRAFAGHLMSHKTGDKRRHLRRARMLRKPDVRRIQGLLHHRVNAVD